MDRRLKIHSLEIALLNKGKLVFKGSKSKLFTTANCQSYRTIETDNLKKLSPITWDSSFIHYVRSRAPKKIVNKSPLTNVIILIKIILPDGTPGKTTNTEPIINPIITA